MVLRQIEIERTAGDAAALDNAVQELVAAQRMGELPVDVPDRFARLIQLIQDVLEPVFVDTGCVRHARQRLAVPAEFLQQF